MTEDSVAAGKWMRGATALAHVAKRTPQGRILNALLAGAQATARSFFRVAHLLFLEVTGSIFIWFALIGGYACWREYRVYAAGKAGPGKAIVAGCFCAMFLWFGVTSFWRARRKQKT